MSSQGLDHRSRRAFRLRTPLTLMVLLAVLVGASWYAVRKLQEPPRLSPPGHCVAALVKPVPRGAAAVFRIRQVKVTVFNSPRGRAGLASATSSALANRGFVTGAPGNDPTGTPGVALVRAADRRLPAVALVLAQVPGATFAVVARNDPSVDLVLGPRFRSLAPRPAQAVAITARSVAFPPDCRFSSAAAGQ